MARRKQNPNHQTTSEPAADVTPRATSLEPGEPVEAEALSQMGSTFAERAKAVQSAENKAVKSAAKKS